jgi:hopanoid-associated phosphorylase
MTALVVVCGLEAEAAIARNSDVAAIAGGGDAKRIMSDLERRSPSMVLSFGVAGGLAPGLLPGDIRVADTVIAPDRHRFATDVGWSAAMAAALAVPLTAFAGVDTPLADARAKAVLHGATGAECVDMESHIVAEWAAGRGARFAALRVITDPAHRTLPHAATVGMRADGRVDLAAIMISLARNPTQLPALIRTGLDARTAFAALLRCRQRLGPRFALLDL